MNELNSGFTNSDRKLTYILTVLTILLPGLYIFFLYNDSVPMLVRFNHWIYAIIGLIVFLLAIYGFLSISTIVELLIIKTLSSVKKSPFILLYNYIQYIQQYQVNFATINKSLKTINFHRQLIWIIPTLTFVNVYSKDKIVFIISLCVVVGILTIIWLTQVRKWLFFEILGRIFASVILATLSLILAGMLTSMIVASNPDNSMLKNIISWLLYYTPIAIDGYTLAIELSFYLWIIVFLSYLLKIWVPEMRLFFTK